MPRLVRRDGVFYFRMAVPKQLVPAMRRAEVKTTLRTGDLSIARSRARRLSEAFETLFGELGAMPDTTFEVIDARVREYMQASLNKGLELARFMPGDTVDSNAEVIGLREDIKRLRDQLASQTFASDIVGTARKLLEQAPSEAGFQTLDAVHHASEGVARARIENARILAARLEGKPDETALSDPLFIGLKTNALPPLPGEVTEAPPRSSPSRRWATATSLTPRRQGTRRRRSGTRSARCGWPTQ